MSLRLWLDARARPEAAEEVVAVHLPQKRVYLFSQRCSQP